jgi:hypothetical protein
MTRRTSAEQMAYERQVSAVRTHLGEQTFTHAWEEGRSMTPEQALAAEGKPFPSDQPLAPARTQARKKQQR